MATELERIAVLEANYENICKDLDEIKGDIKGIKKSVNGLNYFKWKIVGISIAVSAIVAAIPTVIVLIKFLNL
jgi:hypothetical protein